MRACGLRVPGLRPCAVRSCRGRAGRLHARGQRTGGLRAWLLRAGGPRAWGLRTGGLRASAPGAHVWRALLGTPGAGSAREGTAVPRTPHAARARQACVVHACAAGRPQSARAVASARQVKGASGTRTRVTRFATALPNHYAIGAVGKLAYPAGAARVPVRSCGPQGTHAPRPGSKVVRTCGLCMFALSIRGLGSCALRWSPTMPFRSSKTTIIFSQASRRQPWVRTPAPIRTPARKVRTPRPREPLSGSHEVCGSHAGFQAGFHAGSHAGFHAGSHAGFHAGARDGLAFLLCPQCGAH